MVERAVSRRAQSRRAREEKKARVRGPNGGRRPGAGRRPGSLGEVKKVAIARAAMTGGNPHEIMYEWARLGYMLYEDPERVRAVLEARSRGLPAPPDERSAEELKQLELVRLEPVDRGRFMGQIMSWYKPPFQPRPAPGEQPPALRLELDPATLAALADRPDQLEFMRETLRAIQAGAGASAAQLSLAAPASGADPERYASMLSEDSETAGRA